MEERGGDTVVEGRRGILAGVADNISNLGGSAEKGLRELGPDTWPGDTLSTDLKVELNIGSGVLTVTSWCDGKIFLMVDGDTDWVWGSSSISLNLSSRSLKRCWLMLGEGGCCCRCCGGAAVVALVTNGRDAGVDCCPWSRAAASTLLLTRGCLPSGLTSGPLKR